MGLFDYRRIFHIVPLVSIRRRRRGETPPENDLCDPAPQLVAGRGEPRTSPRRSSVPPVTPLQAGLIGLLVLGLAAAVIAFGFLATLVVGLFALLAICFLLIFIHLARHRPGKGPPLRRRQD